MKVRPDFIQYEMIDGEKNIFPKGITDKEALDILKDFFLGEDFYIVNPVSPSQANVYIVDNILNKFPKQYKKFCIMNGWQNQSQLIKEINKAFKQMKRLGFTYTIGEKYITFQHSFQRKQIVISYKERVYLCESIDMQNQRSITYEEQKVLNKVLDILDKDVEVINYVKN